MLKAEVADFRNKLHAGYERQELRMTLGFALGNGV